VGRSIIAHAVVPNGRLVLITSDTWAHVISEHEYMAPYLDDVVATLEYPDHRRSDKRPGREQYYKRGVGPLNWLRAVIEFEGANDRLVTAFGQRQDPRREP